MTSFTYTHHPLGQRLRDKGIESVSEGRQAWLDAVRKHARMIAEITGQVCINDIRCQFELPPGAHHNLWGTVFKASEFELIGFDTASHPSAHSRRIGVYKNKFTRFSTEES